MTTSESWIDAIHDACYESDPASSNRRITEIHYSLSEALARALGQDSGPNFHTWAVWGSRKAGTTIRQEDLGSAIRNATITAGAVGALCGAATGLVAGARLRMASRPVASALGALVGVGTGAAVGRQIAIWSRQRAADLILQGNQTVLQDIGEQSARFIELLHEQAPTTKREQFFKQLRLGRSEDNGQDRLALAFHHYLRAFDSIDPATKCNAMIDGNCEIVYHEHIRLEPYIRGAMPFIIRRCATERMMSYDVGGRVLQVSRNVPGSPELTAARDWTNLHERMRYVFALFREFHYLPEVFSAP